jgi:short-subunit dehydrogenase
MRYRGVQSIVTGGSSGIGRALVARLVDRGSHLSILAIDAADLEQVAADYADAAGTVTT